MACPYCNRPTDELVGVHSISAEDNCYLEVIFNAHCNICNKDFKQRYWAQVDYSKYENIKEEDYGSE